MSSDGARLAAIAMFGSVYMSTDAGASFVMDTSIGETYDWEALTMSSDAGCLPKRGRRRRKTGSRLASWAGKAGSRRHRKRGRVDAASWVANDCGLGYRIGRTALRSQRRPGTAASGTPRTPAPVSSRTSLRRTRLSGPASAWIRRARSSRRASRVTRVRRTALSGCRRPRRHRP